MELLCRGLLGESLSSITTFSIKRRSLNTNSALAYMWDGSPLCWVSSNFHISMLRISEVVVTSKASFIISILPKLLCSSFFLLPYSLSFTGLFSAEKLSRGELLRAACSCTKNMQLTLWQI